MVPKSAHVTWADLSPIRVWSLAQDDTGASNEAPSEEDPCPELLQHTGRGTFPGLLSGFNVITTSSDGPSTGPARGVALGNCATKITGSSVDLRVFAPDDRTLVLQVFDSKPSAAASSWVDSDHFEVWVDRGAFPAWNARPLKPVQLGVGLGGQLYRGVGTAPLPRAEHWTARDERHRAVNVVRLTWSDDAALFGGVVVGYSHGEAGHQAQLLATGAIVRNRPVYLSRLTGIPVSCGVTNGLWNVAKNDGNLDMHA